MQLEGYTQVEVTPWENVSGGKAVECAQPHSCTASFRFAKNSGFYDLDVQYFDLDNGESTYRVFIGKQLVDEWTANAHLPATKIGGDSATRRRIKQLQLHTGDEIRIEGIPADQEPRLWTTSSFTPCRNQVDLPLRRATLVVLNEFPLRSRQRVIQASR